jgi:hypothetical protein
MAQEARAWNLNDVSILYPLPKLADTSDSNLLRPSSRGNLGALLPESIYEKIGTLSNASEVGSQTYENLKALAVRFDPCPASEPLSSDCAPELRVVWQPVTWDESIHLWTTEDAAIHTFYKLTKKQFSDLKTGFLDAKIEAGKLGVSTENIALGIHPAMLNIKSKKQFQLRINALLLANIGEQNMYRYTFMKLFVPMNWWKFFSGAQKNFATNTWESVSIPLLQTTEEDILNDSPDLDPQTNLSIGMDASIFTLYAYPEKYNLRYIISTGFRKTYSAQEPDRADYVQFEEQLATIHKLQNPHLSNPHTVDCAHCHYADASLNFAVRIFPELKGKYLVHSDHYLNPNSTRFNLENTTIAPLSTKIVRAFGYFENQPAINQRVINDSAESANYLNKAK